MARPRPKIAFSGEPIEIRFLPRLRAHRGKLTSGESKGVEVLAGSFPRRREMVLDSALRGGELTRILLHELFHFAWIRLSNAQRDAYAEIVRRELDAHARGELGWSAESRKSARGPFRDYLCESFCDTGAWLYGTLLEHEEFTLAARWRGRRAEWFARTFPDRVVRI